ncbi:chemotaxis protein CheW [Saccharibacillus sp. CPCC 101409]|uniref:chemotaxis protein CheW n=1 Tax=Saccharibacillus sp. CPCC 101409 TaxID=3058041 RepID=UPI0026725901|nr:chemotaxis protein CheW [Saccharibacillus sp. CPCC 101409]MDO3413345.1 chemotaxis protein CheW [Saccharibacillus sp. CPCC 101409]
MSDFILFKLADKTYGIPFGEIDEIQNSKPGTSIPFSADWHEGVVKIREDIYTILSLRKKLNVSYEQQQDTDKFILLRREKVALLVDSLDDTASVPETALSENEETASRRFLPSVFEHGDRLVLVLSVEALLASTTGGGA